MATKSLFRFSLVCAIIATCFMFIAFASPYWYQSWRRVHSPFGNIGLWQVCLNGFIMPKDPVMKSYVGCWWIHSSEFDLIKDDLQPVWFRFIQGFCVISFILDVVSLVILLIYLRKNVKPKFLMYRIRLFFTCSGLLLGSAFLVFLISLVFAEKSNDSDWMPRPWMNHLSYSYGLCVVSGFFGAFGGMSMFVLALIYKDKELNGDPELTSAAELASKQRKLEKQDEMMRQQGGMLVESAGPRTPYGSGAIYRPGVYQHQAAYPDRPDHRRQVHHDPPPLYGSHQAISPPSVAGSQVSKVSQNTRATESCV